MNIDYPFHFDTYGRTASTDENDHVRDMIEQLLFTNPGERVNRPDFGSGLLQLTVAGHSIARIVSTYSDVPPGELGALFGSTDHLEVAAHAASAADANSRATLLSLFMVLLSRKAAEGCKTH